MRRRLVTELSTLARCEERFGISARSVEGQLIAYEARTFPEPPMPTYPEFKWPTDGNVELYNYWKQFDRH